MKSKVFLGLCLILSASVLRAQISTSFVRGVIQDPSGAAVAGASVKLTEIATGTVRNFTSAADGQYSFPNLPVGTYDLEVTKEGFSKYEQKGIVLQVASSPSINVTLTVGALTQEVTVEAQAARVDLLNPGVGQVTPPEVVQDLPLNGRQVTDLLALSPAVGQGQSFRASYPSSAVPSVAGGMQGTVSYWLDGGTHLDPLSNQNLPLPFPDTVQEFKLETSSLPAQYGTLPAGAVNVVTKSGTNSFHGDAFEFFRNTGLDARNTAFAGGTLPTNTRNPLNRNQFGGTVGGPIFKDKLFFFMGFQETVQRSSTPATSQLPTAAMLAGNFQPCLGTAAPGKGGLGAPFGTGGAGPNQINPADYSPVVTTLETHLPVAPGVGPVGSAGACGLYNYFTPVKFNEYQALVRIDFQQSSHNRIFGRYFLADWQQKPGNPNLPADEGGLFIAAIDGASDSVQSFTLGDTYLLGTSKVNDAGFTFTRSNNLTVQNSTLDLNNLFTEAGIPANQIGNIYQLGPSVGKFFPNYMTGFSLTGVGIFGIFNSTPSIQPYNALQFWDNFSLSKGAHQLTFGTNYINLRAFAHNYLLNQGSFAFDGSRTGARLPSSGLADYLLGYTSVTSGFSQDAPIPSLQRQNVFTLFAQDQWKATRKLTITAGLRWDPFFGHTVPNGQVVTVSLNDIINNVHSKVFPTAPAGYLFQGDPGGPSNNKLSANALNQWSPRLGLAWDPTGNGRTAIRAGFGLFYDFPNFSYDQFGFEQPYGGAVNNPAFGALGLCTTTCLTDPWGTLAGAPNPFSFTDQQSNAHVGQNPFPTFVGTGPKNAAYLPGALVFSYPPQYTHPTYIMQYNLTVEQQYKGWVFSVGYLGNQQRNLWGNNETNPSAQGPCPPGYPFPPGVSCGTPPNHVPNGPCSGPFLSTLPPFVCGAIIPGAALNNNRMLQHFGSLCSPTTSCYGETLLLQENLTGNYNGLLLTARHPFANHFTSITNFTWSHCISDNYTTTLGFFLATQAMPFNKNYDRGNCENADTHLLFNESLVAETPKFSGKWTQAFLGNWRLSLGLIVQSGLDGQPINILDFSGSGNGLTQRPVLIPGDSPYCQPKGRNCWWNPKSFAPPAAYTFSPLKFNALFGPGAVVANTGLAKIFPITERQSLEFRWETFNFANHANLYPPENGFILPNFGQPTAASTAGLGALNQTINDPRVMQLALKYTF